MDASLPDPMQLSQPESNSAATDEATAANAAAVWESALRDEEPLLRSNPRALAMEKDVTDLIIGLSKSGMDATPMKASVAAITKIIKNDMLPKVVAFHNKDQLSLFNKSNATDKCRTDMNTALAAADVTREEYKNISKGVNNQPGHLTCRKLEETLYTANEACKTEQKRLKVIKEAKCKIYSDVSKRVSDESTNTNIVKKGASESVEAYVKRMSSTICGNKGGAGNGGYGKTGFLDELLNAKQECDLATQQYNEKVTACKKADVDWRTKRNDCDSIQDKMDLKACAAATANKDACKSYAECYRVKKVDVFDVEVARVETEEKDRKAEWRGLKRMECLIDAFGDGRILDAEVNACKNKVHDTKNLTIVYPSPPGCGSPIPLCGGTSIIGSG